MSSTITRRALLAGASTAIASAALAMPYVNAVRADEVRNLPADAGNLELIEAAIEQHQTAWLKFERACEAADRLNANYGGLEAETVRDKLSDAEEEALLALMSTPAMGRRASNRKATYLLTTIGHGGRWEPDYDNVCALLGSLL